MDYIENIFKKGSDSSNSDAVYSEIVDDIITANVKEAIMHFMGSRSREISEDARYFYKKKELDMFYKGFHGDPNTLVCNPVYDEHDDFLCWEIVRKTYFEEAKRTGKNYFFGREEG